MCIELIKTDPDGFFPNRDVLLVELNSTWSLIRGFAGVLIVAGHKNFDLLLESMLDFLMGCSEKRVITVIRSAARDVNGPTTKGNEEEIAPLGNMTRPKLDLANRQASRPLR